MPIAQECPQDLAPYLAASPIINWTHPAVLAQARALAAGLTDEEAIARACFEFVRDDIRHSLDAQANPVDRKSTRLNSSHLKLSRMPSSA